MNNFDVIAVDLSSLAYRSYFGLPDSIKSIDGKPVNAIKGYLDAINRFKKTYNPKYVIHAIDTDWRPQWRVDLLPQYKAHRVEENNDEVVPDDLDYQLELLPEILTLMGMQVIGIQHNEADDVLASICSKIEKVVVITGDRDLLQLVNDKRSIAVHMLGKDGGFLFSEEEVESKYGVTSGKYIDYAILKGDASDGLSGVKGIGEKSAAKLIHSFDSVSSIIEECKNKNEAIPMKQRESILNATDYLDKARKVVSLRGDLDFAIASDLTSSDQDSLKIKYANLRIENQITSYFRFSTSS